MLSERFDTNKNGRISQKAHNRHKVNYIRYADDFIVTAATKEIAQEVKELLKPFLAERGLQLSEEKTLITNINEGFDMLGWTFRKFRGKLIIKPSQKSVKNLTTSLTDLIRGQGCTLTQEILIYKVNQKLMGWGNYHRFVCSKNIFQKVDRHVYILLWKWACHRHPRKGRKWIKERYWHSIGNRNWVFSTAEKRLIRHPKLNLSQNPYLNQQYFLTRCKIRNTPVSVSS